MKVKFAARIKERLSKSKVSPKKTPLKVIVVGFFIVISILLARNIFKLFSVQDRIDQLKGKIGVAQKENQELKNKMSQVNTPDFVEYEVRSKLGYAKEGEVVVVLPSEDYLRSLVPDINDDRGLEEPNWEKWLRLFFEE